MPHSDPNPSSGPGPHTAPLREMLTIALPAVVGMLSFSMMQFVDRLLCSQLISPEAMTAAGNGGIASWVPGSVMMGLLGVINTYVSQNLGAGKPERGPAYAWAGLWMSLVVWLFVLIPYAIVFPNVYQAMREMLGLAAVSEHLAAMESAYGRFMLTGMIFTLAARTLGHYFYGMHKPWIVMSATIIGNLVNLGVSYCLVQWAKAGAPSIEALTHWSSAASLPPEIQLKAINGAAIGTVIGLFVEALVPALFFLIPASARRLGTLRDWKPSIRHMREVFKLGWPGGLMFGNEMVCWWIFMGGYVASFDHGAGRVTHGQAGWITHQYLMLSFMPAVGISIATTAIVGKCIGAGRHDLARARTWLAVRLTVAYMGTCGVCFVLFGPAMSRIFLPAGLDPEVARSPI